MSVCFVVVVDGWCLVVWMVVGIGFYGGFYFDFYLMGDFFDIIFFGDDVVVFIKLGGVVECFLLLGCL